MNMVWSHQAKSRKQNTVLIAFFSYIAYIAVGCRSISCSLSDSTVHKKCEAYHSTGSETNKNGRLWRREKHRHVKKKKKNRKHVSHESWNSMKLETSFLEATPKTSSWLPTRSVALSDSPSRATPRWPGPDTQLLRAIKDQLVMTELSQAKVKLFQGDQHD